MTKRRSIGRSVPGKLPAKPSPSRRAARKFLGSLPLLRNPPELPPVVRNWCPLFNHPEVYMRSRFVLFFLSCCLPIVILATSDQARAQEDSGSYGNYARAVERVLPSSRKRGTTTIWK